MSDKTLKLMQYLDRTGVDFRSWHFSCRCYNQTLAQAIREHIEHCVDIPAVAENPRQIY